MQSSTAAGVGWVRGQAPRRSPLRPHARESAAGLQGRRGPSCVKQARVTHSEAPWGYQAGQADLRRWSESEGQGVAQHQAAAL